MPTRENKSRSSQNNVSSITSAPFSCSAGDWIVVIAAYRDADAETINTPSVSGATVGAWTEGQSAAQIDDSARYARIRISAAQVTTAGSNVTVTTTTSRGVFTLAQSVDVVSNAGAVAQIGTATGTSKPASFTLALSPASTSGVIAAIAETGFDVTSESVSSSAGWTDDPAVGTTAFGLLVSHDFDGPQQSITWNGTGITAGKAHAVGAIELTQATVTGSGDLSLPAPTMSGAGDIAAAGSVAGSGALVLPIVYLDGDGQVPAFLTWPPALPPPVLPYEDAAQLAVAGVGAPFALLRLRPGWEGRTARWRWIVSGAQLPLLLATLATMRVRWLATPVEWGLGAAIVRARGDVAVAPVGGLWSVETDVDVRV